MEDTTEVDFIKTEKDVPNPGIYSVDTSNKYSRFLSKLTSEFSEIKSSISYLHNNSVCFLIMVILEIILFFVILTGINVNVKENNEDQVAEINSKNKLLFVATTCFYGFTFILTQMVAFILLKKDIKNDENIELL